MEVSLDRGATYQDIGGVMPEGYDVFSKEPSCLELDHQQLCETYVINVTNNFRIQELKLAARNNYGILFETAAVEELEVSIFALNWPPTFDEAPENVKILPKSEKDELEETQELNDKIYFL